MYEKIKEKLFHCGGKLAAIVNMLPTEDYELQIHKFDNIIIIEIPYLYKLPNMESNYEALRRLKEVIDGLSD